MKKIKLTQEMTAFGWWKYDEGSSHEKWTNGELKTTVPRHREINEMTAKSILKLVKANPKEKDKK